MVSIETILTLSFIAIIALIGVVGLVLFISLKLRWDMVEMLVKAILRVAEEIRANREVEFEKEEKEKRREFGRVEREELPY